MLEDHQHIWITQQKEASQITYHARISVVAQRCALHVSWASGAKDCTLGFSAAGAAPSAAAGLGALGFLACHITSSTSQQSTKAVCVLITPLLIQRCSNFCTAGTSQVHASLQIFCIYLPTVEQGCKRLPHLGLLLRRWLLCLGCLRLLNTGQHTLLW